MLKYISERQDSMIEKISKQITNHLIQKNVIKNGSVASGYKKVIKTGSNLTSARGSYSATKNGSSGSTSLSC